MRIAAITQHGVAGWRTLKFDTLDAGLNAIYGPTRSGKSLLADLLAHALFGKSPSADASSLQAVIPGEVVVESDLGRHRVRRYRDDHGTCHLTVASLDGSTVDAGTMRQLVGGLTPGVLGPLCAVSFRQSPNIAALLSADFARGYQSIARGSAPLVSRRTAELTARRDALAQELESRIAGERRASKELEDRCQELERVIREEQQRMAAVEQRLQITDTALAETDARLRYRRLELNLDREGLTDCTSDAIAIDEDAHVGHVRNMLAELAQQEAAVRARLAEIQAAQSQNGRTALAESRAWLKVARQLATDLSGEVARLARATASQQCVCRDAHPRLRPISETIQRQLDVLSKLIDEHQRALAVGELQTEVDHLARSQDELRRHLESLLHRRQAAVIRRHGRDSTRSGTANGVGGGQASLTAADAAQLENRLLELEQERFRWIEQMRAHERKLRDLRAEHGTVERQRGALLSARSIDFVQRELAVVQQKLEQTTILAGDADELVIADDSPARASDYLAQLTNGSLVRLQLVEGGRRACVVTRNGRTLRVESLIAAERDLVYLSLCLALLAAARRHGVCLPLVLDDPFERLDGNAAAALAAVLEDFARQGHQVLVFTSQSAAANRLASAGAAVHDISNLRERPAAVDTRMTAAEHPSTASQSTPRKKHKLRPHHNGKTRKPKKSGNSGPIDHSDAA